MSAIRIANLIALPGALVQCPQCSAQIGTLTKPWYQEQNPGLDTIRFERGQYPKNMKAQCRGCGASYAEVDTLVRDGEARSLKMLLFVNGQWLPRPPPNVPEPPRLPIRDAV